MKHRPRNGPYTHSVLSILLALLGGVLLTAFAPSAIARSLDDPVATANVFRSSLLDGNTGGALSLLSPDVLVYSHGEEHGSREAYANRQLKQDIATLSAYYVEVLGQKIDVQDNIAWVSTRLRLLGKSAEKPEEHHGTETLVLRRSAAGWQIIHLHRSYSWPGEAR